jgi:glutathione S-transferase
MPSSGNSYKVRLLLALLGQSVETIDVEYGWDSLLRAKAEGALPFGKAPVLELDDGTYLPESNAILTYLGQGTPFLPQDALAQAQMLAWMFWEQNQHEGVIAVRAALLTYPHRRAQATPERMAQLLEAGHDLLALMNTHLATRSWLVGDSASLADICLYGYTHSAGAKGGFEMDRFPAITAWLGRVQALPGFVALEGA